VTFGLIAAGMGAYLLTYLKLNMWIVLPVTILLALFLMRFLSPKQIQGNLDRQFSIFKNKHNWIMTILYVMTFGSFIGYSASFPKLIQDVFGYLPGGAVNPNAPNPMAWAFLGPLVGAMIRPIGGWFADKIKSGSKVTAWSTLVQVLAALGVAYFIVKAKSVGTPEIYWWPFFTLFMIFVRPVENNPFNYPVYFPQNKPDLFWGDVGGGRLWRSSSAGSRSKLARGVRALRIYNFMLFVCF
jgi:NNP family nitrate/nitrite transporter-like MFS transporter